MKILLDTSAWIDFFNRTVKGENIRKLFYDGEVVYTCSLSIAEVSAWCHKNNEDPKSFVQKINELSTVVNVTDEILIESGKIYVHERKKNEKISMINNIIYSTSRSNGLVLITLDKDFENLAHVKIL